MQLLVSVATAQEAIEALAGGADIIDAKDPRKGPLGPVDLPVLGAIRAAVPHARPLTAALGDGSDAATIEALARSCATAGVSLVKLGFAGVGDREAAAALLAAAMRGASGAGHEHGGGCGVVAVAYADTAMARSPPVETVISIASEMQCRGLLIDTFDKSGPGLCRLLPGHVLAGYAATARRAGLLVALAGQLRAEDLNAVREAGADVAGVRGAACDGGRLGRIRADRVVALRARCGAGPAEANGSVLWSG
jgi:(5-formylfuran-3-yl)methyl phosphate synthase